MRIGDWRLEIGDCGAKMSDTLLREQIAYYRARASEYEETALPTLGAGDTPMAREWRDAERVVHALPQYTDILELACGTGVWTRLLTQHTEHLTALDAAPEMLELNRAQVNDARVNYECVNLFEWEATQEYELVFMAFWLSHVPDAQLDLFLQRVRRALKSNGTVFILDEPRGTKNVIPTNENIQARTLNDGRTFSIVKEYYAPEELCARMRQFGFSSIEVSRGDYFFWLRAARSQND